MSWDPNQQQGQIPSGPNPYNPTPAPSGPNPYNQMSPAQTPGKIFNLIPVPPAQTPGKLAFWHGLIFGLILAGGAFIFLLLETFIGGGLSILLTVLTFLGALALYFFAGMQTTKATGSVGMGAITGLWVGVIYGLINVILAPIIVSIAFNANAGIYASNSLVGTVGNFVVGAIILANIGGWILEIGFGAGAGAIGGLVAKNQLQASGVAGYPAQPYAGQPTPYGQPPSTPYGQPPSTPYGQQPYAAQPTDQPKQPGSYS